MLRLYGQAVLLASIFTCKCCGYNRKAPWSLVNTRWAMNADSDLDQDRGVVLARPAAGSACFRLYGQAVLLASIFTCKYRGYNRSIIPGPWSLDRYALAIFNAASDFGRGE